MNFAKESAVYFYVPEKNEFFRLHEKSDFGLQAFPAGDSYVFSCRSKLFFVSKECWIIYPPRLAFSSLARDRHAFPTQRTSTQESPGHETYSCSGESLGYRIGCLSSFRILKRVLDYLEPIHSVQ